MVLVQSDVVRLHMSSSYLKLMNFVKSASKWAFELQTPVHA